MNVRVWLHLPSATWHQAALQVLHVLLFWMWRYVLVVFKPLNDLYILTCLSCHAECSRGDCVLISLRQSLNWTNALWTAFGTSECCTEYTVEWRLNGVCLCQKVYEWPLLATTNVQNILMTLCCFIHFVKRNCQLFAWFSRFFQQFYCIHRLPWPLVWLNTICASF